MFPGCVSAGESSGAAAGFHTTHWSVVLSARAGEDAASQEALANLCSTYWYPLYAFIRRQGTGPHEAEDLTQAFFCHLLEKNAFAAVKRDGGKFRSFLLACLKNFVCNERERAGAQRRGGGCVLVPLDTTDGETRYALEPADQLTPDAIFERRWAFALLERTIAELRTEYSAAHKQEQFEELEGFLPGGRPGGSRAELAAKRGVSIGAIDVAIHRLKQRFGAQLRVQIAQTVSCPAEVDEEIRHLIAVLGS